ncbi:PadR family transcriptional regulator [Catelliglobosispora koreensis]|uniref:PadR family transcriptional regulator n=1 Tax=Catelliglobosispora koreensis TaxID=129052 RepID=UPI0007C69A30|nr:PadR family transcriptional regulator [Catelliglobosispora koreensis]
MFSPHRHEQGRRFRRGFPGFPPFEGGMGHGRGHGHGRGRGRRGDTRAAVLALLAERPMHGYEMISELEQRTGGFWRPSPGSIYPTLQLLEDEGLIVSEETGGRKRFTLTEPGRTQAESAGQPWQRFDQGQIDELQQFREAAMGIMNAMRQVGTAGSTDQRRQALEVLNETKRKLYAILAAE